MTNLADPVQKATWKATFPPRFDNGTRFRDGLVWHEISGVCLSSADGLLIPTTSIPTQSHFSPLAFKASITVRAKLWPSYSTAHVKFATGRTLISDCWRVTINRKTPSHFLFGLGKLLSHLVGVAARGVVVPVDNVVLHQCANVFNMDFKRQMIKIIWRYGVAVGAFHAGTNIVILPYGDKRPEAAAVCVENAAFCRYLGLFLGSNHQKVVSTFRKHLAALAAEELPKKVVAKGGPVGSGKLRIKIFQRTGGSALRRFVNLHEVVILATNYSNGGNVEVITTNETMSFWDQYNIFNSFDVLISPHGSHLTNGILVQKKMAVIEVVPVCFNHDFKTLESFGHYYKLSTGHTPIQTLNRSHPKKILRMCLKEGGGEICNSSARTTCHGLIQYDLLVDIDILRGHLEETMVVLRQ